MRLNQHIARLLAYLPAAGPKISVLDIGCGDGRAALWVASGGASVTAFDQAWRFPVMRRDIVRWLVADLHNIEFRAQFDALLLLGVLHYMRDAVDVERVCYKLRQWAKPGGLLLAEWITDTIPHPLADAVYLPPVETVRQSLRVSGFSESTLWLADVSHKHDGPRHRHKLVYGVWAA